MDTLCGEKPLISLIGPPFQLADGKLHTSIRVRQCARHQDGVRCVNGQLSELGQQRSGDDARSISIPIAFSWPRDFQVEPMARSERHGEVGASLSAAVRLEGKFDATVVQQQVGRLQFRADIAAGPWFSGYPKLLADLVPVYLRKRLEPSRCAEPPRKLRGRGIPLQSWHAIAKVRGEALRCRRWRPHTAPANRQLLRSGASRPIPPAMVHICARCSMPCCTSCPNTAFA